MTASDSSSSATSRAEAPPVDLLAAGLLPPLPAAFLADRDRELLRPLRFRAAFDGEAPEPPPHDRAALADALAAANSSYGHPRARELARQLADPRAMVVVTGQQPGLFGGPLYTLSKAVAASLWAERVSTPERPAVAVFWVATEDHDFREVASTMVLGADGPLRIDLGDDPAPLTPVGMRTFGEPMRGALETFRQANRGERWEAWAERLAEWYRPDARFGEAFCRLLAGLLGDRCPLLLDSMLPELKSAQRPWLRKLVEERHRLDQALQERDKEIERRGYDLQVKPQAGASPLFALVGGERRRVEWRGEQSLALRGDERGERPVDWLLRMIDDNPGVISPGVLARAAVQDAVLGSGVLILGPGEVSYMPQVAPVYELLDIRPPEVFLRPQTLVLGEHQLDKLATLELGLADFAAPGLDLDRALAQGEEEDLLGPARERFARELRSLEKAAHEIDPNLEGPWRKTRGQIERALETFGGKVAAALARRNELEMRRARDLRESCRPLGEPQERVLGAAHFPGKYGDRLAAAYFEQLELDPGRLQVIRP